MDRFYRKSDEKFSVNKKKLNDPYFWEKRFAGVSDLKNILNLDIIESLFIFGVFHIAKKQSWQYLTHFLLIICE
jgi:hypothetical protein